MNRRKFLRASGSAAALSLTGGLGPARPAQALPEVDALHRLIEETPHERVAAELAALIRDDLDHRRTLAALAVATSRHVQPFPHVGFKYHTVLALQAVHLTALNLPRKERWLPVFWALDYFKRAQEQERRQSGWTMGPRPEPVVGTVEAARRRLIDALDRWDPEAVDPAILDFARLATPEQLSEILFRYGARDLRANRSQGHRGAERAPTPADRRTRVRASRASLPRRSAPESRLRPESCRSRPAFRSNLAGVPGDARRGPEDLEAGVVGRTPHATSSSARFAMSRSSTRAGRSSTS